MVIVRLWEEPVEHRYSTLGVEVKPRQIWHDLGVHLPVINLQNYGRSFVSAPTGLIVFDVSRRRQKVVALGI